MIHVLNCHSNFDFFDRSSAQTHQRPPVLSVSVGLREPQLHRSGPEEVHLGAAVQTADERQPR